MSSTGGAPALREAHGAVAADHIDGTLNPRAGS